MPRPSQDITGLSGVPASFAALLGEYRACFSAWTFPVFCALACGLVAQGTRRSVCGMLVGARLSQTWSHHRAHRFFSHACWSLEQLSGVTARLVCRCFLSQDEPVTVAVDDTLFSRRGPKVHAASWFHDGSAAGERKIGYGNNWVIAAIVVRLSFMDRPVALPVAFALIEKGTEASSRLDASRCLVEALAEALDGRTIHVVADSAYAGKALRGMAPNLTWTTRLRRNAALFDLAPPRTGRPGRPKTKGDKLPALAQLASTAKYTPSEVTRYAKTTTIQAATITCLWYGVFGPQHVQVIVVRDKSTTGYDIALVTTDLNATPRAVIERYAQRWSIEVAIEDAKQTIGVGQARNRVRLAVERTVPFALTIGTLTVCWYATHGHHPDDVTTTRNLAPWYRTKTHPSVHDMTTKLRRVIIATQFQPEHPHHPTPNEINILHLAWANAAA